MISSYFLENCLFEKEKPVKMVGPKSSSSRLENSVQRCLFGVSFKDFYKGHFSEIQIQLKMQKD